MLCKTDVAIACTIGIDTGKDTLHVVGLVDPNGDDRLSNAPPIRDASRRAPLRSGHQSLPMHGTNGVLSTNSAMWSQFVVLDTPFYNRSAQPIMLELSEVGQIAPFVIRVPKTHMRTTGDAEVMR
jgi:hypothetical protein